MERNEKMRLTGRHKIYVENKEYDDVSILEAYEKIISIHNRNVNAAQPHMRHQSRHDAP